MNDVALLLLIFIFAYVYCLLYAPSIEKVYYNSFSGNLNRLHKKCMYTCKTNTCKSLISGRGNTYFINTPEEEQQGVKNCLITFWGMGHFLLFTIIGYLLPGMFFESLIIGIAFEIYEYNKYDCADPLDILYNTGGFLLGALIRSITMS
jgi:hypothetical protein